MVFVNVRFTDIVAHIRGAHLIVNPPSGIVSPGLTAVRPPGVLMFLLRQTTERIDKLVTVKKLSQPFTLFRQKTRIFLIAAPVFYVFFLMRYVPVTT